MIYRRMLFMIYHAFIKKLNCQECDCGTDCTTYNTTNISSVSNNSTQCSYNLCQGYTIQVPDSTSVNLLCTCDVSGCDTCNPVDGLGYDTCLYRNY